MIDVASHASKILNDKDDLALVPYLNVDLDFVDEYLEAKIPGFKL